MCECARVCGPKGMAVFPIVNFCIITTQLSLRADPDHVRTRQQGPQGRQNSTGVRKNLWEERVCNVCKT